ncbi:MAG: DUF2797 domain-containing protein [Cryomorphaceae bacterium]|nr:DUF2797 domain-containing protein [Flavobacteriales bacterium]
MRVSGTLRKMSVEQNDTVQYKLNLDRKPVLDLNALVGSELVLEWDGEINCINCGTSLKKTYGQGFCYPCFRDSPQAAPCIMRPELCEAHLGKGRDVEWEEAHHNQPHAVYLAQTGDVKVGVTRATQIPARWIDQGAYRALQIAKTPYRRLAGEIEVELKQFVSDRTDWRRMLVDARSDHDLIALRDELLDFLPEKLAEYATRDTIIQTFNYPVMEYPEKVKGLKLEDLKQIKGMLTGIRGQYLMFDAKGVINLRKYSGYKVSLNY